MSDPFNFPVAGEVVSKAVDTGSAGTVNGVQVVSLNDFSPCCLATLSRNPLRTPGQRDQCSCGNILKAENRVYENPSVDSLHPVTGLPTRSPSKGHRIALVSYDSKVWLPFKVAKDLKDRNEIPMAISRSMGSEIASIRPLDWFEKGSFHAVTLDKGVVAIIGKVKEEFSDSVGDVSASVRDLFGVESF